MNLIIPMAGMGKRMRPHTLTLPKPLFKIAGKTIVQRLIEDISKTLENKIDNIGFVIGDFGEEVENYLLKIANENGCEGNIFYQKEALGTAHAVFMAEKLLYGKCIIAFADTLFRTDKKIKNPDHNVIWTYEVEDPSAYGVVKTDDQSVIKEFIEKPELPVSNKAIIGIYYFAKGELIRNEIKDIIDKNNKVGNEFQLTTALENLKNKQQKFVSFTVDDWYDCGNWKETIQTNQKVLDNIGSSVYDSVNIENTLILDPVFIGNNVKLKNAVIGPHVSIEDNTEISNSVIRNSIVKSNTRIDGCVCEQSIIGKYANVKKEWSKLNVGDYTNIK